MNEETEHTELAAVLSEIAEAMGGNAAALTMHPSNDEAPILISTSAHNVGVLDHETLLERASCFIELVARDAPAWVSGAENTAQRIMLIPVVPIPVTAV